MKLCHHHLDEGFEADGYGHKTRKEAVRFPAGKLHSFSDLYKHFTGSSHLGEDNHWCISSFILLTKPQDLEFQKKTQPPSAVLNRIIGSCLDHTAGLSFFCQLLLPFFRHFLPYLIVLICQGLFILLFSRLMDTSMQALCNSFILVREIHSDTMRIMCSILG